MSTTAAPAVEENGNVEVPLPVEPTPEPEPEQQAAEIDIPIEQKAKAVYEQEVDYTKLSSPPIIIRDLSVPKDREATSCCAGKQSDNDYGLQMAPNVASAILGHWLASKIGLGGPSPSTTQEKRSDMVYQSTNVVTEVSAMLLPGEATLLLGPSSSGKTTLMRTLCDAITGEIDGRKSNIEGTIRIGKTINPLDPAHKSLLLRSAAFVDQGDLSLTPILTVEETVLFASRCTNNVPLEEIQTQVQQGLELVGLDHVKGTVVGNADIRGVSGGQKRRVKLMEMAVGQVATTIFFDEVTNGLDAASAGSLCKVARTFVETTGAKCMMCLLQPSQEVYDTFHKLILLTPTGQVAYSGPSDQAMDYFEGTLGLVRPDSMTVPEFLLGCAVSPQDFAKEGATAPTQLNTAFTASEFGQTLKADIEKALDTTNSNVKASLVNEGLKPQTPFALGMIQQIKMNMGRSWKLVLRNPSSIVRLLIAALFGIFIGTLFLNTKNDENGTSVRSGYVLTLVLLIFFNASLGGLADIVDDRITFYLHRKSSFYSTASYYISQMITSTPVALMETFLLCILSYFLVPMSNHSWWAFLYFWAMFSLMTLVGGAISRILGYTLPTADVATTLGSALTLLFVLGAGNSPQYTQLAGWLKWLGWISPTAYSYEGIMVNELMDRNVGQMTGVQYGQQILGIPRIPYPEATLAAMSNERALMAFDAYILIAMVVFFEFVGFFCLRASLNWYGPTTKRYQVVCGMSLAAPPNFEWKGKKEKDEPEEGYQKVDTGSIPPAPLAHLTARNIVYEVDVPIVENNDKEKETKDQDKLEAAPESNQTHNSEHLAPLTAKEYGQSNRGAAQNWVLRQQLGDEALSTRSSTATPSLTSIRVELDPVEPGRLRLLSGITGTFEPRTMTALMGSSGAGKSTLLDVLAGYKTGGHISGDIAINCDLKTDAVWNTVAGYCEQVDCHNPVITVKESLIFAARMRLRPFDAPDSEKVRYAEQIMDLLDLNSFADILVGDESAGEGLPKHARKRLTVGVELTANPSILFCDEPTSGLDGLSAKLVVDCLERAAKQKDMTVVCTIHQPSRTVFEAFDNLLLLRKGGVCVYNGPIADIPEYLQSAPNSSKFAMDEDANPADHYLDVFCGPLGQDNDWGKLYQDSEMAKVAMAKYESCRQKEPISADTAPRGIFHELSVVLQRQLLAHWRTPSYMSVRFLWTVFANLILGLVYFQTGGKNRADSSNVLGAIFFYVNIASAPMQSATVPLVLDRAVFYRETASGTYRKMIYSLAVQLAEHPFNLAAAIVAFVIFYYMVGLDDDPEKTMYFALMSLAVAWLIPTLGQLMAFISPNIGVAVIIGTLFLTLFSLTMGFLIPANNIPPWYIWIYWLNPLRYIMQGLVSNEIGDSPQGQELLDTVGWSIDDRWFYCYFAVIMFGFAAAISILFASRISWLQR